MPGHKGTGDIVSLDTDEKFTEYCRKRAGKTSLK
jgi:hypothetical protein